MVAVVEFDLTVKSFKMILKCVLEKKDNTLIKINTFFPKNYISERDWDLGHFSAILAPGQTSPQAIEYKETTKD